MSAPRTLYDKIWDDHLVDRQDDGTCLLYIDRHLVHEVTSPQAFEGLRMNQPQGPRARAARWPWSTTTCRPHRTARNGIKNEESRIQVETLAKNAADFGIEYYSELDTPPGHRPHRRAGAGLHPAGHDHRLRRQPHLDARRLRRAGARHRHLGGRARAGHPDADPAEGQEHAGARRRPAAARRHRQGHHPRHHRRDRHRRRHRPRHRVSPARRSARCRWKAA